MGAPTPLECSLTTIKYQKWSETPYQNIEFLKEFKNSIEQILLIEGTAFPELHPRFIIFLHL